MRYGIVVDTQLCMGCRTCAVVCKMENNLPAGVWWNRVLTDGWTGPETHRGTYGDAFMRFVTVSCQHCDRPACVEVCPVGATYKDAETGIVCQDVEACIGCRACIAACPYDGVRTYLEDEPRYACGVTVGDADAPLHQAGTVEKCTMCRHRVVRGEEPACVAGCPAYARVFGDLDDPSSEAARLLGRRDYGRLMVDRGTGPNVYYLV